MLEGFESMANLICQRFSCTLYNDQMTAWLWDVKLNNPIFHYNRYLPVSLEDSKAQGSPW